jgi:NAD(P)-dependent dehydrogenase (short-subunit alcohol dehydrogenase family)
MRSLKGSVAVVTGAGSGIGRALAEALAARGADLALADVDAASLAQTRAALPDSIAVSTHEVDVSERAQMTRFRDEVERVHGRASLLINNAGAALYGSFDEVSIEDLEWIMGVNFWGTVYGCEAFLPLLRREPEANIVTLSSLFGLIAPALQIGYSASKFAVRGFSEALRHELAYSNVKLTVVHPGGVKTPIARNSRKGTFADEGARVRDCTAYEKSLVLEPATAATLIVRAVLRDRPRLLIGRDAFLIDKIARLFPAQYMRVVRPLLDPTGGYARRLKSAVRVPAGKRAPAVPATPSAPAVAAAPAAAALPAGATEDGA